MRSGPKKRARRRAVPRIKLERLLFLVVFLYRLDAAIVSGLGFSVFHGFLGFGGFLGASFGALFFFLVEDLLAAQQFEKSLVGAVTLVPVGADDAGVSAL